MPPRGRPPPRSAAFAEGTTAKAAAAARSATRNALMLTSRCFLNVRAKSLRIGCEQRLLGQMPALHSQYRAGAAETRGVSTAPTGLHAARAPPFRTGLNGP